MASCWRLYTENCLPYIKDTHKTNNNQLWHSLKMSDNIDTQTHPNQLKQFGFNNRYLNYEGINNNKHNFGKRSNMYNYKVLNPVDLSKLFLQTHMSQYTGFDETCDCSALLGIIINVDIHFVPIKSLAENIRSDIRNKWAHCYMPDWTEAMFRDSVRAIEQLIRNLGLSGLEESKILAELDSCVQSVLSLGDTKEAVDLIPQPITTLSNEAGDYRRKVLSELEKIRGTLDSYTSRLNQTDKKVDKIEDELNSLIPPHIRAQHKQTIEEWKEKEHTFLVTRATRHVMKQTDEVDIVTVVGSSGSGKSSIIHHVALHLQENMGFKIIPFVEKPEDILRYLDGVSKYVFVIDDICGKETIDRTSVQKWTDIVQDIEDILRLIEETTFDEESETSPKFKILISCRLHIFKENHFQCLKLFTRVHCNLLSDNYCLLKEERKEMIGKYIPYDRVKCVEDNLEDFDFFPLLCRLSKGKTNDELIVLFSTPLEKIKDSLDVLIRSPDKLSDVCSILICLLFFQVDRRYIKNPKDNKTAMKMHEILNEIGYSIDTEVGKIKLLDSLDALSGTYLQKYGGRYRMIHDKIEELAFVTFGQKFIDIFIKHASAKRIADSFSFERNLPAETKSKIVLEKENAKMYFDRILSDIKRGNMTSIISNSQLKYDEFRQILITHLKNTIEKEVGNESIIDKLRGFFKVKKSTLQSFHNFEGVVAEFASTGYTDLAEFLINIGCNINSRTGYFRKTALLISCLKNNGEMVKLLLKYKADVSQCFLNGKSPLLVACEKDNLEIIRLLLENKANAWQCDEDGTSPLFKACENENIEIVRLLLAYNAKITPCLKDGKSPLNVACKQGNVKIVKLLLDFKADLSACSLCGEHPLAIARKHRKSEIEKLLLQYKADVPLLNYSRKKQARKEAAVFVRRYKFNVPQYFFDVIEQENELSANIFFVTKFILLFLTTPVQFCLLMFFLMLLYLIGALFSKLNECTSKCLTEIKEQLIHHKERRLLNACIEGDTAMVKDLLKINVDVSHCDNHGTSPLLSACKQNKIDIVRLLLEYKANVSQSNDNGSSPLLVACWNEYTDIVGLLLEYSADVSQCNRNRLTPLLAACWKENIDIMRLLLENNADVSQSYITGKSPLLAACERKNIKIVRLLLENKADVSQSDIKGKSPLLAASESKNIEIVRLLLENKADVSQSYITGKSPLLAACERKNIEIVRLLLENKADVSQSDIKGKSPLLAACESKNIEIVRLLLENKADVSQSDIKGKSPLLAACKRENIEIVKLLLENKADVSQSDIKGKSPLLAACERKNIKIVRLILENKADVLQSDIEGKSPLLAACESKNIEIVRLLLENKADVSQSYITGKSPLLAACERKNIEIMRLLLENKADVSQSDIEGKSPLLAACERKNIEIVKLLLENKADVSQSDITGKSPLLAACERKNIEIVRLLLENKADVSQSDIEGKSPLFAACERTNIEIVKLLLENKADVSQSCITGQSPLLAACERKNIEIVRLLLENKADVSQSDIKGKSPLLAACESKNIEIVRLLLENKADVSQSYITGKSPLLAACKRENIEIVKLLLENKADVSQSDIKGKSPLLAAYESKNIEIVRLLLENKAESQSDIKGKSSLLAACE